MAGRVEHSVSTWRQPVPPPAGLARQAILDHLVRRVETFGRRRVRVAIDGHTAAGKTSFGHELAGALAEAGRVVLRASLDDFQRPWREAHTYDRASGEGFYRNAADTEACRRLLLEPAAPDGSGRVVLCSIDPVTQVDRSEVVVEMPVDGVLVVDGVFASRPELEGCWDLRIWIRIDPELSVRRSTARDAAMYGGAEATESLHRERWLPAEQLYVAEVDPVARADVVIDNTEFTDPVLVRP